MPKENNIVPKEKNRVPNPHHYQARQLTEVRKEDDNTTTMLVVDMT